MISPNLQGRLTLKGLMKKREFIFWLHFMEFLKKLHKVLLLRLESLVSIPQT